MAVYGWVQTSTDREADHDVVDHEVRRIVGVLVGHVRSNDRQRARLAVHEVDGRDRAVKVVGPPPTLHAHRAARRAGEREPRTRSTLTGSEKVTLRSAPGATLAAPSAGTVEATPGAVSSGGAAARRVGSEPVERVGGEARPLDGGIEGVGSVGVACADRREATERVVRGAGEARAPLASRDRNPPGPMRIDDGRALAQLDRVVAVEPARPVGLVGLGEDRGGRGRAARRRRHRRWRPCPTGGSSASRCHR